MPHPSMLKMAIIVLNWNRKQDTLDCLNSLKHINYPNYSIILVDNHSTDDSISFIQREFPNIHCIINSKNLGFAGGNNVGIAYALKQSADIIILLNNDTIVASDLLLHFMKGFEDNPQAGILGGCIYLFDQKDTLDHLGGVWLKKQADVQLIGFREKGSHFINYASLDYVCGACIAIKRCVFESIGMLESRYFLYWEENDFCLRAKCFGFQVLTCPQAKIWHKVSASLSGGPPHSTYFWWRGRLLWIERNYNHLEKIAIYLRIIFPAFCKILKLIILKNMQLGFLHLFYPQRDHSQQRNKLLKLKAGFTGIKDYLLRRFDQGPAWISRPRSNKK